MPPLLLGSYAIPASKETEPPFYTVHLYVLYLGGLGQDFQLIGLYSLVDTVQGIPSALGPEMELF